MELRHNSHKVEIREEGGSPKIFGYGSVFFREDDPGTEFQLWDGAVERVMPGAFDRAIREDDVRGLFNHDTNMVLGRTASGTMNLSVDDRGLKFEIEPPDTMLGRDLTETLRRGDVSGSSIAFMVNNEVWKTVDGQEVREIYEIKPLFDVGPVTFPAFESTESGVRSLQEARMEQIASKTEAINHANLEYHKARADYYRRQADLALMGVDLRQEPEPPTRDDFRSTPFADLPIVDEPFNPGNDTDAEIIDEILSPDGDDFAAMKKAYLSFAPGNGRGDPPTTRQAYKLKIARRRDGNLTVFFPQLASRIAIINGARGGVDIPDLAKQGAFNNAIKYYEKLGIPEEDQPTLKI